MGLLAVLCLVGGLGLGFTAGYLFCVWNMHTEPLKAAQSDAKRHGVGYLIIKADRRGRFTQLRLNPTQVFVTDKPLTTGRRFR